MNCFSQGTNSIAFFTFSFPIPADHVSPSFSQVSYVEETATSRKKGDLETPKLCMKINLIFIGQS